VARLWPGAKPSVCSQCGYSRLGLAPGTPCPECTLVPGGAARGIPRALWTRWAIGAFAFFVVMAAYALIARIELQPSTLMGDLFAASFMGPAAALVPLHIVLANQASRWISTGEALAVAWFASLGAVVAGRIFVRNVDLASDAQAGIVLVGASLPGAAGVGYGALMAALGAWHLRTARQREP
jgi:hypothetical protein